MNVSIACGGTGGHIFPGLATAEELERRGHKVTLWLTGRDIEKTSIKNWEGPIIYVKAEGLPPCISFRIITSIFSMFSAFLQCRIYMKKILPDVLLAMGSYASVGPVLAAKSIKVPVVLHEANAIPGKAISILAHFSSALAITFDTGSNSIKHNHIVKTGLPLRTNLKESLDHDHLKSDLLTILLMGGSQGAHKLNQIASSALYELHKNGLLFKVIHITGSADKEKMKALYIKAGIPAQVFSFLNNMSIAYKTADLAITRAGAATCAELSAYAVPAIFVPLPSAGRNHQMANAIAMQTIGGAEIIAEADLSMERLSNCIRNYAKKPEILDKMRRTIKDIAIHNGAEKLADLVEQTGNKH